jgi:mRNA-degrading endonuclease toxin of MazEF toxin-antitoxin module
MLEYLFRLLDWCKVKIVLSSTPQKTHFFKEREVWWCSIGVNIGDEEFGKGPQFLRPVLVFKKFSNHSFLGLPLTGTLKEGSWYVLSTVLGKRGSVMLNQARIFDKRRLVSRIETIPGDEFEDIRIRFRELYCP